MKVSDKPPHSIDFITSQSNLSSKALNKNEKIANQYDIAKYIAENITKNKLFNTHDPLLFIQELVKKTDVEEAFHVIDIPKLVEQYQLWQKNLPNVTPYYAVKTNHDPVIVNVLASLGLGFDCASMREIKLALSTSSKPSMIIFAHPRKTIETIREASTLGIKLMTFDSLEELNKIQSITPNAELILRIKTNDHNSLNPLSSKFGASMDNAKALLEYANINKIAIKGISFHVGSNANDATQYLDALNNTWELIQIAKNKYGVSMSIIDLGGGWPGNNNALFARMASVINNWFSLHDLSNIKLIAEPGRFFSTQIMHSAIKIIGKEVSTKNNSKHISYYLADGIYGSYLTSLYYQHNNNKIREEGWNFQPLFTKNGPMISSTLWGPTCDSGDYISKNWPIQEMESGEYIYSDNMGAYTTALQTPFNGIKPSKAYYIWTENYALKL